MIQMFRVPMAYKNGEGGEGIKGTAYSVHASDAAGLLVLRYGGVWGGINDTACSVHASDAAGPLADFEIRNATYRWT